MTRYDRFRSIDEQVDIAVELWLENNQEAIETATSTSFCQELTKELIEEIIDRFDICLTDDDIPSILTDREYELWEKEGVEV